MFNIGIPGEKNALTMVQRNLNLSQQKNILAPLPMKHCEWRRVSFLVFLFKDIK